MQTLDDIVTEVSQDCAEEYRRRMRSRLMEQPREWLVEQLLEYMAGGAGGTGRAGQDDERSFLPAPPAPPALPVLPAPPALPAPLDPDEARANRIRAMEIDERCLASFAQRCQPLDREALEARGYLIAPPSKGSVVIDAEHRTRKGNTLLREAKDLLHALLFGDPDDEVRLHRVHRELVTITVPNAKMAPLAGLLSAATVIQAEGTWRDPDHVADDDGSRNALVQVEYGEVANEAVGHGIKLALRLINDLEINEQVLYARMENVEESTLV